MSTNTLLVVARFGGTGIILENGSRTWIVSNSGMVAAAVAVGG